MRILLPLCKSDSQRGSKSSMYFCSHCFAGCLHFKMNHWPPTPLQLDILTFGVYSFQIAISLCSSWLGGCFKWTMSSSADSWCCRVQQVRARGLLPMDVNTNSEVLIRRQTWLWRLWVRVKPCNILQHFQFNRNQCFSNASGTISCSFSIRKCFPRPGDVTDSQVFLGIDLS